MTCFEEKKLDIPNYNKFPQTLRVSSFQKEPERKVVMEKEKMHLITTCSVKKARYT